jgi:hypothetical protein
VNIEIAPKLRVKSKRIKPVLLCWSRNSLNDLGGYRLPINDSKSIEITKKGEKYLNVGLIENHREGLKITNYEFID